MTRKRKSKKKAKDTPPILGRHYNTFISDDLVANQLTYTGIQNAILEFSKFAIRPTHVVVSPFGKSLWEEWLKHKDWSKEEMAKQVEIYRNVIETKYGVKLCIKDNLNKDMITMELLVPNKLFHSDDGRQSLADAFQNIAMFVMSLDDEES